MTTATQPLTVQLPVCPECSHVGKVAGFNGQSWCTGGRLKSHPRKRMQMVTFEEKR